MSNEKSPLVGPTITVDGGVKEEELKKKKKKKEGKGSYLAYGVLATTLYLGFVAKNRNGIFTSPSEAANLLRSSTTIDALLLQDTLLSSDTSTCTPLHGDPNDPKSTGPCCKGLQSVTKDWDGDRWYSKCQPNRGLQQ